MPRHAVLLLFVLATALVPGCRASFLCRPDAEELGVEPDLAMKGPLDAPIVVEEFSEFQCPFCKRAHATLAELDRAYPGQIRFIFRHYPLEFHAYAEAAARAGVAAQRQDKFWPFHDLLFASSPDRLSPEDLLALAQKAGLDVEEFRADLGDPGVGDVVNRDIRRGQQLGVQGVPHFFVNGRRVRGAQPIAEFRALVDEELQKADELLREGVEPLDVARTLIERNRAREQGE